MSVRYIWLIEHIQTTITSSSFFNRVHIHSVYYVLYFYLNIYHRFIQICVLTKFILTNIDFKRNVEKC